MIWRKFFLLSKKMEQCAEMKDIICYEIAKHCDQLTCKMLMSTCQELREFERNNTNDLYPYDDMEIAVEKDAVITFKQYYNHYNYTYLFKDDGPLEPDFFELCYSIAELQAINILKFLYYKHTTSLSFEGLLLGACSIPNNDDFVNYILNLAGKCNLDILDIDYFELFVGKRGGYSLQYLIDDYNYNLYSHINLLFQE